MIFANNTVFALAFVLTMLCLLHCLAPHNPGILLVAFLSLTFACLTCSSLHASTLHPWLAYNHLSYVNCFYAGLYDLTFMFL